MAERPLRQASPFPRGLWPSGSARSPRPHTGPALSLSGWTLFKFTERATTSCINVAALQSPHARYGGPVENHMRFSLEVVEADREVFPAGRPVTMRVSATDWAQNGWDIEQTVTFCQALEAGGCSPIHVSSGGHGSTSKLRSAQATRYLLRAPSKRTWRSRSSPWASSRSSSRPK